MSLGGGFRPEKGNGIQHALLPNPLPAFLALHPKSPSSSSLPQTSASATFPVAAQLAGATAKHVRVIVALKLTASAPFLTLWT